MLNKFKIILFLFSLITLSKEPEKLILGGWADGSITDYSLKIYPNYTFELTHISGTKGNWIYKNDTIILFVDGKICAKLHEEKLISNNCKELNSLRIMEFIKSDKSQIIRFPK
jgi:hypothetical protein